MFLQFIFIIFLNECFSSNTSTASKTSNPMLVVQIEKPATLPCLVSDPSTARWMFTPPGSADGTNKDIVANGKTMMRNFVDFIIVSDQAHQYDLNIRRVRFTDAGSYFCKDESNMATIELVVLDDQPTCNFSNNTGEKKQGEAVINCTIQYKGRWAPNIGWTLRNNKKEIKSFKTTNETLAVVEDHATSLISVTVDPSMRGSNFICETTVGLHNLDFDERVSNRERLEIICPSFVIDDFKTTTSDSQSKTGTMQSWMIVCCVITGVSIVLIVLATSILLAKKSAQRHGGSSTTYRKTKDDVRSNKISLSDSISFNAYFAKTGANGGCGSVKRKETPDLVSPPFPTYAGVRKLKSNSPSADSQVESNNFLHQSLNRSGRVYKIISGNSEETSGRGGTSDKDEKVLKQKFVGADGTVYEELMSGNVHSTGSRSIRFQARKLNRTPTHEIYASIDHTGQPAKNC